MLPPLKSEPPSYYLERASLAVSQRPRRSLLAVAVVIGMGALMGGALSSDDLQGTELSPVGPVQPHGPNVAPSHRLPPLE